MYNGFVCVLIKYIAIGKNRLICIETLISTGSPLILRFLGPRKKRINGNPYY